MTFVLTSGATYARTRAAYDWKETSRHSPGLVGYAETDKTKGRRRRTKGGKIDDGRPYFARNLLVFVVKRLYIGRRDDIPTIYQKETTIINRKWQICGAIIVNYIFCEF